MKQMTYLLHFESHASARKDHATQIQGSSQAPIPGHFPWRILSYLICVGELYFFAHNAELRNVLIPAHSVILFAI